MAKGKSAKPRPDSIDAVEAREVLQLLDCNAAPPAETLQKVFRLNMGPCSAACGKGGKGSRDNPCCFHGLLPAENSYRKKGLWQKEPVLGQLGHDPAEDRQKVPGAPAGLRNLGNTCYVNAAMQFLHSLPAFRQALYMLEPHLAEQDIVKQMRDLFIEMHFGPKRYVDPEPFANSLLLDPAIQQDGQEFLKLLLSKLEAVFAHSQRKDVAAVVQGLFQGHLSHVTTCHTCNRPSENSKREVEFYELSLQVQHMPSLHHSLVAALAPDELVGDNQYFCDYCAAKSDADRRMRLRSLPPYLCLALQRFTYDHETWEKKKVLHKLSIPLRLDMGQVLTDAGLPLPDAAPLGPDKAHVLPGSPNSMYELAAVLIHKGTSASHGHYVAHIKLHDTGTWWRFDDEEAEEMGPQPTTHPGDHGMTAATAAAAAASSGAAAAGASDTAAEDAKPAVGKKRGRGGSSAPVSTAKRGRGASRGGGRGGGRKAGRKAGKRDPWEEDSDADAEAEAATAAAEAVDQEELQMQQAMQLSLAEANGDINMAAYLEQAAAAAAGQAGGGSRSKRRADAPSAAGAAKGRGRGRGGRGRGKAAADPEEPAEPPAAPEESRAAVPPAVVEQILSANAYFLVYRHCPSGTLQPAQQLEAAAPLQAPAEAAVHAGPEATKPAAEPAAAAAAASEPAAAVLDGSGSLTLSRLPPTTTSDSQDAQQQQQQQEQQQKQQQTLPEQQQQQSHQEQLSLPQEQQVPLQAMDQNVQVGPQQAGESVKAEDVKQQQKQEEQQQHLKTGAGEGPHPLAVKQLQQPQQQQQQQQPGVQQQPSGMEQQLPPTAQQLQAQLQELPEAVQQQVAQLHSDFDNACRRFQQRKDEALAAVANRQQEVSSIVELLPVPEGDSGCLISTSWLEGWVNGEEAPEPIDNSVLLCEHQRLSPLLPPGALKFISDTAWQELTARHRGGPRLSCDDVCVECLRRVLQGLVSSEGLVGLRDQLLAALEEDEANQEVLSASAYYVSKPWVVGFKRRTTGGGLAGRLDAPTAGITCPHGGLAPEGRSGAKRFAVSPETWAMLRRLWPQQVLMEAQARRDKAARAAAKRAATGGLDVAAVANISKDDDVVILDSPQKPKQQQQEQAGQGSDGDDVCMVDAEPLQQQPPPQEQQQQGATGGRASPEAPEGAEAAAAAAAGPPSGWQLPFPLDGSVPLSERLLLQHLPEFQVANVYDCAECAATLQEAAAGHQEVKQQLEGQKQTLGKLLAGTVHEALEPGVTYCLVPNAWLDTWRKHLHAALSKKLVMPMQLPPVPEPLPQAVRSLLCKCHPECPLLAVPLPGLVNKRGRFSQADPQKDALRVITEREWQLLLLHHSGLQLEEDTAPAAAAAVMAEQLKPAAVAATRLRRRGSKSAEQQEALALLQKEEQQQLFAQRIASMAAVDPGFRGVRACLKVAPLLPQEQQQQQQVQELVLAEPNQELQGQGQGQQTQQQPANGLQQEQEQGAGSVEQQQQQHCQQAHRHPAAGQGEPQQQQQQQQLQQQQHEQVCQANGIHDTQQQLSKDGQEVPKQQQEQQQQHDGVGAAPAADDAARDNSNESVDLTASPPQGQRRSKRRREVAQVDLSGSPRRAQAAPGAGVVVVDLASEPAAGATTAAQAAGSDAEDMLIDEVVVDADPAGLQEAAANASGDEWQPERTAGRGSRPQRQSARRAGLARTAAAGSDAAGGSDSEEPGAIPAAAAALRGWLETVPGLCEATLQAEAAARRAATLVYDRAELMVELITEEELQAAFAAGPGERRSRRARKNRQPVQASSTDTLATLRLKVFEVLSVHPRNQRLYVRGQLLSGEVDTLAKLEVFPDEEIRVVNSNQVPDDDYTSVFDGVAGKRRAREVETGFKDTALHGSSIPAAVADVPAADPSGPTSTTPAHGTNEATSPAAQQASGV